MAISSVVLVADNAGIDTVGAELVFMPGGSYPATAEMALYVREQPVPSAVPGLLDRITGAAAGPPDRVVPAITDVRLTYGRLTRDSQPPRIEPADHWLRELSFSASYVRDSWRVVDGVPRLLLAVSAGLRDNSPPGDMPDDGFVAHLDAQALCIWTRQPAGFRIIGRPRR
jgi:hypothetical protein